MAVEGMRVEVEEIPPLPDALEVHIPVADTGEAAAGGDLLAIGVEPQPLPEFDLESRLELLPLVSPGDQSSLLNPGSMWSVRGLTSRADKVEVAVGRSGSEETSFLISPDQASGLERGALVVAPSEDIYDAKSLFGLLKTKVEFRPDRSSPPVEIDTWLPVLRLHCPHRPGCE